MGSGDETEPVPVDLEKCSLDEMKNLPGIGEVTGKKLLSLREAGIPLSMSILESIPHIGLKKIRKNIADGMLIIADRGASGAMSEAEEKHDNVWFQKLLEEKEKSHELEMKIQLIEFRGEYQKIIKDTEEEKHIRVEERRQQQQREQAIALEEEGRMRAMQEELEQMKLRHFRKSVERTKSKPWKHPYEINMEEGKESDAEVSYGDDDEEEKKASKASHEKDNVKPTKIQDQSTEQQKNNAIEAELAKIDKLSRSVPIDGIYKGVAYNKLQTSTPKKRHRIRLPKFNTPHSKDRHEESEEDDIRTGHKKGKYGPPSVKRKTSHHSRVNMPLSSDTTDSDSTEIPSETDQSEEEDTRKKNKSHSRHEGRVSRSRRRSPPPPKLPTFSGAAGKWRPFIFQFKEIAKLYQWSKKSRMEKLMSCLTDQAVCFVQRMKKEHRRDYKHLLKALEIRYDSAGDSSNIRTEIFTTDQTEDESIDEWADRIFALTLDGYPDAPDDMVESLSIEHFFRGCTDGAAALAVSNSKKFNTIRSAVKQMKDYLNKQKLLVKKKKVPTATLR